MNPTGPPGVVGDRARRRTTDAAAAGRAGYDFEPLFAQIAPDIRAADQAICHLETPVAPYSGFPLLSVPPQITTALRRAGFDTSTCVASRSPACRTPRASTGCSDRLANSGSPTASTRP